MVSDQTNKVIEEHTPVQSENKSKAEKEKAKKNKEDVKNPPGKEDSPGPPGKCLFTLSVCMWGLDAYQT